MLEGIINIPSSNQILLILSYPVPVFGVNICREIDNQERMEMLGKILSKQIDKMLPMITS
jgi:hypothetical protein